MNAPTCEEILPVHPERMDELLLGSYHEGGHMAVAEGCGIRVTRMEIHREWRSGLDGTTWLDIKNSPGVIQDPETGDFIVSEEQLHGYVLCCLTGWRAVRQWFLRTWFSEGPIAGVDADYGACSDMKEFRRLSRIIHLPLARAIEETDHLIHMHWGRIERATEQLYVRRRLNQARVAATATA